MDLESVATDWWRDFGFEDGQTDRWEIGNLTLWLRHAAAEWRLAYAWDDEDRREWRRERGVEFPVEGVTCERFAMSRAESDVHLRALTADRSVVARPRVPLRVPPGQEAKIYVSSPLSVEIAVGSAAIYLRELPTRRLSKTWFGSTTREGEVVYALATEARTESGELPTRPYRVATPVVIDNRAEDTLVVERLNLPVPRLSLFGRDGQLWSEAVRLVRAESGNLAQLDIRPGPPAEASDATPLGEPRVRSSRRYLFRAFSSILRLTEIPE